MNVYLITQDGDSLHIVAPTVAKAILAWQGEMGTNDEPDLIAVVSTEVVIWCVGAGNNP